MTAKRLRLLHDLVPKAVRVAVLVNPAMLQSLRPRRAKCRKPPPPSGYKSRSSTHDDRRNRCGLCHTAREHPDALFVAADALFVSRRVQLATLTARDRIPAIYPTRDSVEVGGLMSYGPDLADMFHQVGVYTGSILKGAKPADLPVLQSTKFEFVINLTTAKALGLTVPAGVLSIADETIE